ncbi:hypothetical protein Kpol_463p6 [Vanderwaltozyma polyspora DSM 70294]|uniref:Potassium channel domain-containing protein n=1 Tax=Vanderwaltozyma polyspora (strain ATCC 22028 / DSM 70294 / BCRC 21397 / CBS 2163 / NBRC 10782 / NRRL Y-8283 / UCD 57-17) TaxID=436907 RepID=A7TQJ3_VANPO|nr:uncharacterized protein Kpol_463p6 [Vanderwaltozyma polyspora DSM 70294]EDO15457.1 hypothetical protein Kpol_463p6 [Vanderwaltozyma polyspora DSM 70294]
MAKSNQQGLRYDKKRMMDPALNTALRFNTERVTIINQDPNSRMFITWFVISCYFPVITACLGPIANTLSIACVVEKWRADVYYVDNERFERIIKDPKGIFALNILSLVIGFSSNVVLLLHFAQKLSYLKSQLINITGWTMAGTILMVDVIVCAKADVSSTQSKTIGFWIAVITTALYFGCTFTLTVHFIGYRLNKYPARFNLITNERAVMVFTVMFSVWLIWGAGLFSSLLHIPFCDGLYFSVVSLLTIGFGDISPNTVALRILSLVYSLSGVMILGLIVAMTRGIIQRSLGPIFYYHRVEVTRKHAYQKLIKENKHFSARDAYNMMQRIRVDSKRKQTAFSLISTITVFIMFWLIGAVVFKYAESWGYFTSIYFCFLCLLTIGYGDYTPVTGAGRAFFIIWALAAVPLMSAILSTVGDTLYDLAKSLDITIAKRFHLDLKKVAVLSRSTFSLFKLDTGELVTESDNEDFEDTDSTRTQSSDMSYSLETPTRSTNQNLDSITTPLTLESTRSLETIHDNNMDAIKLHYEKLLELYRLVQDIVEIRRRTYENGDETLSYSQWAEIFNLHLLKSASFDKDSGDMFWLSESTPLKFPMVESTFAVAKLFKKISTLSRQLLRDEAVHTERENKAYELISSRPTTIDGELSEVRSRERSSTI